MIFDTQPHLENDLIILKPLKDEDFDKLFLVASDPLIWEQHPSRDRCQKNVFKLFFKEALASNSAFIIIEKNTEAVMGSTRFTPIDETENAVSIGWTFLARKYWGGVYNKSLKILMMDYAFTFVEHVLFYIHENNFRSQKAVEKLGAKRIRLLEKKILKPRPNATFIYGINRSLFLIKYGPGKKVTEQAK